MSAINEALNNAVPMQRMGSTHDPVMHSFEKPKHCSACHKLLKGLFYQGYQCTKCHTAVHRDCILGLPTCGMTHPPQLPPRPQDFNRVSIPLPLCTLPTNPESMDDENEEPMATVSACPTSSRQGSATSVASTNGNSNNNNSSPPSIGKPAPPHALQLETIR